eukprot:3605449-Rhodomonas_salina.4
MNALARRFDSYAEIFKAHADGSLTDQMLERLLDYLEGGPDIDEESDEVTSNARVWCLLKG